MEAIRETTVWDNNTPNHTYLLDGTTLVAYIKQSETTPIYLKKGIKGFDKRGRKFEVVKPSPFKDWAKLLKAFVEAEPTPSYIKKVAGSKPGVTYEVNTQEKTCTCPGFTFRGDCKHVVEIG